MESEDVTDLLNLYLETMTNIALDHGATIDKYIGDGIMLFFGDPETKGVKEDAIQCVNMAIEMLRALDNLSDEWAKYGLRDHLQMRIGIDTGFATVGNFGCESRLDYTAIGAAVNRASRLETAADNGSIYISEDTYNLVKDSIEAEALPPIHLKGIGEFQARKVIESKDTKSVSMSLGERNVSFVLDNMTPTELESARQSLTKALGEIDSFRIRLAERAKGLVNDHLLAKTQSKELNQLKNSLPIHDKQERTKLMSLEVELKLLHSSGHLNKTKTGARRILWRSIFQSLAVELLTPFDPLPTDPPALPQAHLV